MPSGQKLKNNLKNSATNYALWLLGLRSYSEKELHSKLTLKKYLKRDIDQAIAKLKKYQLIDDKKLAISWISSRDLLRPRSQFMLTLELKRKGIDQKNIDQAFLEYSQNPEVIDDYSRAKKLIKQYENRSNIQKLALLARRGFTYDLAREVIGKMGYNNNT